MLSTTRFTHLLSTQTARQAFLRQSCRALRLSLTRQYAQPPSWEEDGCSEPVPVPPLGSKPLDELIEDYPLRLHTQKPRRGPFDPIPSWWPWIERAFLGPARRNVAKMTTWGWTESRFPTPEGQPQYFPDLFAEGAAYAFTSLLPRLSNWDGANNDLSDLLCPAIYERFQKAHQKLTKEGLEIEFELLDDVPQPEVHDVWLTFGPPNAAKSTLMFGRVFRRFNPLSFVRDFRGAAGDYYLFREVVFEYAMKKSDVDATSPPTFAARAATIRKGQVVGVDVSLNARFRVVVREKKDGSRISEQLVEHPVWLRFETPHFVDKMEGEWRVADVDRLIQSERIEEEEKCLGREPDE